MSLRDRLARLGRATEDGPTLFNRFGVIRNPFPAAGQPSANPHMFTDADDAIEQRLITFERDQTSQILLIEGTQGTGKTNLLSYYEGGLRDLYAEERRFYVIRYFSDPEPSFDRVVRRVFQSLDVEHLVRLGTELARRTRQERVAVIESAADGYETRCALHALANAEDENRRNEIASAALEWLVGLRLLNRHREALGVQYRLDTVEAKTQALRDVIQASMATDCLRGLFLLLDELEKQDASASKLTVVRYLLALRALVDALPRGLFLLVALTPDAKKRYFGLVPAFAGRFQDSVELSPLRSQEAAMELARFYIKQARDDAAAELDADQSGNEDILRDDEIAQVFANLVRQAEERGREGVTQRDFLNELHRRAEETLTS